MKLLTAEIIKKMPLPDTITDSNTAPIRVKFFGGSSYSLHVISAKAILESGETVKLSDIKDNKVEDIFLYGYVTGLAVDEWGYVSFNELKDIKFPPFGLGIERDMNPLYDTVKELIGV